MKTPLAEGQIKFQTDYQLPTPPEPEIISCRIDKANLFPIFLNHREVLVFGYFTAAVCYSYKSDQGSKEYRVATQTHNLAELIPLKWVKEVPAGYQASDFRLEVTAPESWQCWAEPPVPETKEKGQGFPLLTGLFTPRRRNLVVFVSSIIAVKIFPREEDLPEGSPPGKEKSTPPAAVSQVDYPPSGAGQDILLQMLLEILFSRKKKPAATIYEKQKPAAPPEEPKPAPEPETGGSRGRKRRIQKKTTTRSSDLRKGHLNRPAGKKTIFPAAGIPTIGREAIGAKRSRKSSFSTANIAGSPREFLPKTSVLPRKQEEGPDTGAGGEGTPTAAENRTWPNLARLNPPPRPPGG